MLINGREKPFFFVEKQNAPNDSLSDQFPCSYCELQG